MADLAPAAAAHGLRALALQRAALERYEAVLAALDELARAGDVAAVAPCLDEAGIHLAELARLDAAHAGWRALVARERPAGPLVDALRTGSLDLAQRAAATLARARRVTERLADRRLATAREMMAIGHELARAGDYAAGGRAPVAPVLLDATG